MDNSDKKLEKLNQEEVLDLVKQMILSPTGYLAQKKLRKLLEQTSITVRTLTAKLKEYIKKNDVEKVLEALHSGANIADDNYAAVLLALKQGNFQIFLAIIENTGLDINKEFNQNDTILNIACRNKNMDIIKYAVEHGAYINAHGNQALKTSIYKGHVKAVEYLISNGANLHLEKNILPIAVTKGHLSMIQYLEQYGLDLRQNNDEALVISAGTGRLDILKYFLNKGCDLNEKMEEMLLKAIEKDQLEIIEYILNKVQNINNLNILNAVAQKGDVQLMKYFVQTGSTIELDNKSIIANAVRAKHVDMTRYLVELGMDVKMHNNFLIDIAISKKDMAMISFLIENGAECDLDSIKHKKASVDIKRLVQAKTLSIKLAKNSDENEIKTTKMKV